MINKKLYINYLFFLISIIFLFLISINNNKNFYILSYSVPAYNFKNSEIRTYSYGLNTMGFKSLALTAFSEEFEISEKTSIRHIHYTSGHQISWLLNREKFFKLKKELTPEKLLDISKKIYNKGHTKKNFIKYLNFLLEFNDNTKFEMKYDELTKDFYINYENMRISNLKYHLQTFDQKNSYIINNTPHLTKDEIMHFIKTQTIDKEKIKLFLYNNYYGSYKLDFKKKDFLQSTTNIREIKLSNINFVSRDIYKLSERYIENNTYFYDTPALKEKDIIFVNNNKIQNLKITDCNNSSYQNGFILDCKYFPFKIYKDGLSLNFF